MDGHIQITALRQPQVEKLFAELDLKQMLEDERFSTPDSRANHPEAIFDAMSRALNQQTTQAWMKQLAPVGIPVAEVRELPEASGSSRTSATGIPTGASCFIHA